MPNLADLQPATARQPLPRMGVAGTVVRAPANAWSRLTVRWTMPGDDTTPEEDADETRVRWWCQPGRFPDAGDKAVLIIDSQGDAWAAVWGTGTVPA